MGAHEHDAGDTIASIIAEFTEVLAFSRTRWARYAADVNAELSGVGMMVLQVIVRKGPLTATGISQMLDMDKSIVSKQVAKMRDLGLIDSTEAPEDRRVQLLTCSEKGSQIIDHIRGMWATSYRERFEGWDENELEALRLGLHRFNAQTADTRQDGPALRCAKHASEGTDDAKS
ncbi:MAG: MarR family winged helix-turn-helix transcriptional regulator [Leucobacter sp.]